MMEEVTGFLVTIRNLITRAVSAFNTGHPDNTSLGKKNIVPSSAKSKLYIDCFHTIEHLAMNLQKRDEGTALNESEQACYVLGVKALSGSGSTEAAGHLSLNYAHYNRLTFSKYPGRDILAI
jgi:hypothetical protein